MSTLTPGARLGNRFVLREPIGSGGMSQVWRAEDLVLGRPVAVKVLTAALASDPTLRTAIRTEARAAARLADPHVTQVYDYGETALPDGGVLPFLVMELVDGHSLADRLRQGPLPWQEAMSVTSQVAAALAAAHRIGVVHRDIKPGNVMLTGSGVKVLDFGIAALVGDQSTADGGRFFGTPSYTAPERLQPGPATPASDVYSLGVLLYEALTGHPPVALDTWTQAAETHRTGAGVLPPEVPELPRHVRRLCMDCLSPNPADRPTAEELEHALAAAGQPVRATMAMPVVGEGSAPAAFAVGSAQVPHPPTIIDPGFHEAADQPHGSSASPLPRPLRTGLIGAAVVLLAVVLVLVVAALLPNRTKQAAQPSTRGTTSATPSPTAAAQRSTATSPQAIVDQVDAAIAQAVDAGRIDADAAKSLRDGVKDLRKSLGGKGGDEDKTGEKAQEFQKRIDELLADGKIDQQTADQLTTLLQPLVRSN